MLDSTTKRRIDDCRDILVGKLPDPKSQIEQITIALIYKFMNDMDQQNLDLGGEATFFSNFTITDPNDSNKKTVVEMEKYRWNRLFDAKVGSSEMLNLYMEAIEVMEKNPNIPELFRNVFKNAYLPYRDPETLRMFLKTIGEFEYTHSEKLGDAFEYLLSVMGSQGDAGQFRTPRHIIDFIVEVVDPGKKDSVLDPACGTAGFLISAFNHIRKKNDKKLTPDEQKRIIENFVGYDISPDMVRLSLVNLYLHQFSDPHIYEYDTLTNEQRWDEYFDVILANPPFMSPKGGIRPHKRFSIGSNRSEVLFVDYIAEHLTPNGRAGIIVPEGVIFQSGKAYKELRKKMVEDYLYAVISLPAGVFNPYSGVKTTILLLDKALAKQRDEILFVKIENDGYNLGAQRTPVKGGQLNDAVDVLRSFQKSGDSIDSSIAHSVQKEVVSESGDYNLSGDRYKSSEARTSSFPVVELGDYIDVNNGRVLTDFQDDGEIACIKVSDMNLPENSTEIVTSSHWIKETKYDLLPVHSVIFPKRGAAISTNKKRLTKIPCLIDNNCMGITVKDKKKMVPQYLFAFMNQFDLSSISNSAGIALINNPDIKGVKIPLPPLSVQEEIVAEIEGYQKIVDGAKAVVENYKPHIDIDPDWEMVELGEICEVKSGGTPDRKNSAYWNGEIPYVKTGEIYFNRITQAQEFITKEGLNNSSTRLIEPGTILMAMYGQGVTRGRVAILEIQAAINQAVAAISCSARINNEFLFYQLMGLYDHLRRISDARGGNQSNLNAKLIKELRINVPELELQLEIVKRIKKEQELVDANKQLIEIFEQKIKDRIAKVWGE
jgi:type I restriction enzyme M protein